MPSDTALFENADATPSTHELWLLIQRQQADIERQAAEARRNQEQLREQRIHMAQLIAGRRLRPRRFPTRVVFRGLTLLAALVVTLQPSVLLASPANSWTAVHSMAFRHEALAAATGLDGRIYAIGGTGATNIVEAYTPGTDTWTTMANLPTPRSALAAATGTDGRIYAIGGSSGGALKTVEAYTPSNDSWATMAPLTTARSSLAAVAGPDGRIYAIGGYNAGYLNTVEVYTPSTNTWATLAPLPTARAYLAAAVGPDGRIYAIGGAPTAVEVYTPSTNTWATAPAMSAARIYVAAATGQDGRIYAIGGASGGPLKTVEAYTPSTNSWATVASMSSMRYSLAAATGLDGRIYAIGGDDGQGTVNTVEAYTPFAAPTPGQYGVGNPGVAGYTPSTPYLSNPINAGIYGAGSAGYGGYFQADAASSPLHLQPGGSTPPASGTALNGDFYVTNTGGLYFYNGSSWRLVLFSAPTDARITRLRVVQTPGWLHFGWRLADGKGVAGFELYAGPRQINLRTIPAHPSRLYRYRTQWHGHGPYSLHVILSSGGELTVPAR